MRGMSRDSGKVLSGTSHIYQSVKDILTTPLGTRRMLMGYGSDLPLLVDNPVDRVTEIRVVMATAVALARWEPRLSIDSVIVLRSSTGKINVKIEATDVETQRAILLEDIFL